MLSLSRRLRPVPSVLLMFGLAWGALGTGCNRRFKPSPPDIFAEDVALAGKGGLARMRSDRVRPLGDAAASAQGLPPARLLALRGDGVACVVARDVAEVVCTSPPAMNGRPERVPVPFEVSALVAGHDAVCAVSKADGAVSCFRSAAVVKGVIRRGAPLVGVRALSAFGARACAIDALGTTLCWSLPDGAPEAVAGVPPAVAVGVGDEHACAAGEDGRAFCWGRNREGELGDGTLVDRAAPVEVPGLQRVTHLALGARFSCALTADATVRCWGDNASHQLADGTTEAGTRPHLLLGLFEVFQLVSGEADACARMGNGDLRCWGALRVPGTDADVLTVPTNARFQSVP